MRKSVISVEYRHGFVRGRSFSVAVFLREGYLPYRIKYLYGEGVFEKIGVYRIEIISFQVSLVEILFVYGVVVFGIIVAYAA